jgi:hypothetical protein
MTSAAVYVGICIHICICMCIYMDTYVCIHTYIHTYIYTYVYAYIYTCIQKKPDAAEVIENIGGAKKIMRSGGGLVREVVRIFICIRTHAGGGGGRVRFTIGSTSHTMFQKWLLKHTHHLEVVVGGIQFFLSLGGGRFTIGSTSRHLPRYSTSSRLEGSRIITTERI